MNAVHFTYLARLPGERGNSVKFSEEGEGPRALFDFSLIYIDLFYPKIFFSQSILILEKFSSSITFKFLIYFGIIIEKTNT